MATQELRLTLRLSAFEALHREVDGMRKKNVTISRLVLLKLLQDHGNALSHIRDMGGDYRDP